MANSVDPDEMAHNEPSHLDLHCLHRCVLVGFTLVYPNFSANPFD